MPCVHSRGRLRIFFSVSFLPEGKHSSSRRIPARSTRPTTASQLTLYTTACGERFLTYKKPIERFPNTCNRTEVNEREKERRRESEREREEKLHGERETTLLHLVLVGTGQKRRSLSPSNTSCTFISWLPDSEAHRASATRAILTFRVHQNFLIFRSSCFGVTNVKYIIEWQINTNYCSFYEIYFLSLRPAR